MPGQDCGPHGPALCYNRGGEGESEGRGRDREREVETETETESWREGDSEVVRQVCLYETVVYKAHLINSKVLGGQQEKMLSCYWNDLFCLLCQDPISLS